MWIDLKKNKHNMNETTKLKMEHVERSASDLGEYDRPKEN